MSEKPGRIPNGNPEKAPSANKCSALDEMEVRQSAEDPTTHQVELEMRNQDVCNPQLSGPEKGHGLVDLSLEKLRERLQILSGRLEVESRNGQGSRSIYVPQVNLPESDSRPDIRLMLVDDHSTIREGLARMLSKQHGIKIVAQASDGQGAIELASAVNPSTILMDVEMPGVNGIEATRQIHSEHPQTRIIAFSVHGETTLVQSMLDAGASVYLTKDCSLNQLVETIRSLV